MSKMELLGALEAKKLTKQKWKQYCGTPCNIITEVVDKSILIMVKKKSGLSCATFKLTVLRIEMEFMGD